MCLLILNVPCTVCFLSLKHKIKRNCEECTGHSFPCNYNERGLDASIFKKNAKAPKVKKKKVAYMTCVLIPNLLKPYDSFM